MTTFTHDCDACVSLGPHFDRDGQHDLYFCAGDIGKGSVLARYGDRSEYQSLAVTTNVLELFERAPDYVLAVAYRRAVEMGLIK